MTEALQLQLLNHKLQLQQVEAALELDKDNEELQKLKEDLQEVINLTLQLIDKPTSNDECSWKVGDMCMAQCSRDKLFYKAKVLEILGNSTCVVNFVDYDTTDICQIAQMKPVTNVSAPVQRTKKEVRHRLIEKKKLKKQKLAERHAEIEKACEKEKNQWLNFSKKMNKHNKTKRSIFASPETVDGRVGVGTCGIAGRPMTKLPSHHRLMRK
ncbi:Survival of motor neuron splicing factor [Echinococcus multilocularis]|uniref:Survival of motor neuron splicing factor n=1 Tax=Echinococcus multilocularis TaxID=6211 RepID=A0A068Y5H3_ECHMU|nr:Survival of motor neuron splicing factor [Echinococcus multilocularis]